MRSDNSPVVRELTFTERARRAQIIACAVDALAELGYAGTSLARVAERAGISKSAIPYYFASKDALLDEVVRHVYGEAVDYIRPRIQQQDSAAAMLAVYLRANLEFIRDHTKDVAALAAIAAGVRTSDNARRFAGGPGGMAQTIEPLREMLRRGQASGEFADFDTSTMAWAIRNLIDSVPRQQSLDPSFDFEVCINELIALVDRATRAATRP